MKSKAMYFSMLGLATFVQPLVAEAHPFHWPSESIDFFSGLIHPFTGADHVITMLAVGLWISQASRRIAYLLSFIFVTLMLAGGGMTLMSVELVHAENVMHLSALMLGLMLASGYKTSSLIAALIVGNLALFHGYVHAFDIWLDANAIGYTAGFACATMLLIAVGMAIRWLLNRLGHENLSHFLGGATDR